MNEPAYKDMKEAHTTSSARRAVNFAPRVWMKGIAVRTKHPLCWWMTRNEL